VVFQVADTLPKSLVPLRDPPLGYEEVVVRENSLLKVLSKNG
jgi:hypothetical protein